jgi:hypothetical protein
MVRATTALWTCLIDQTSFVLLLIVAAINLLIISPHLKRGDTNFIASFEKPDRGSDIRKFAFSQR